MVTTDLTHGRPLRLPVAYQRHEEKLFVDRESGALAEEANRQVSEGRPVGRLATQNGLGIACGEAVAVEPQGALDGRLGGLTLLRLGGHFLPLSTIAWRRLKRRPRRALLRTTGAPGPRAGSGETLQVQVEEGRVREETRHLPAVRPLELTEYSSGAEAGKHRCLDARAAEAAVRLQGNVLHAGARPIGERRGELPFAQYVDALLADLDHDLPLVWGRTVHTVFFGGGTPSLMPPEFIDRFLQGASSRLRFAPGCEITMEANPGTAEHGRFEGYRAAGVNRVSFGIQSFDDGCLQRLGRIHDPGEALADGSRVRAPRR